LGCHQTLDAERTKDGLIQQEAPALTLAKPVQKRLNAIRPAALVVGMGFRESPFGRRQAFLFLEDFALGI
jgi:hypothetical protein